MGQIFQAITLFSTILPIAYYKPFPLLKLANSISLKSSKATWTAYFFNEAT